MPIYCITLRLSARLQRLVPVQTPESDRESDEDRMDMQTFTDFYYGKGRFDLLKKLG